MTMNIITKEGNILTEDEIQVLQEIMNIAFGQSTAELTEVIDTHVLLSVPFITTLPVSELPEYIKDHIKDYRQVSVVEQKFWGKFKGDALLIFSSGAGKELISILHQENVGNYESDPMDVLERETLMEVGNILIGACVGKLAELLSDIVTYTPPSVLVEKQYDEAIPSENYADDDRTAIILKTDFSFEEGNVSGFLFLVASNESVQWLKKALNIFIAQYE
jgi:chemotaxis protein CheC